MPTLIDDFTTGTIAIDLPFGPAFSANYQAGGMLGGGRYSSLHIAGDPRRQPAHLDVNPSEGGYFNLDVGAEQYVRTEVGYGWQPDGRGGHVNAPLVDSGNGDFLSRGSKVRTNFHSSNTLYAINFNVLAFTATGWAQAGVNANGATTPFTVDFWFSGSGPAGYGFVPPAGHTPDFTRVSYLVFIFQVWGDLVIDSFEIL